MADAFRVGDWFVEPQLNSISAKGNTIRVEPKIMQVLVCLAEHANEVVSKERLIQSVWADTFVSDDVLTRSISELRRVFGDDPREPRYIQTIQKRGYRVIAQVVYDSPKADAGTHMTADDGHKPYKRRPRFGSRLLQLLTAMVLVVIAVAAFYVFNHGKQTESQGAVRVRSIAVLPFKPLVATSRDESLEFGMADSLITRLGNLKQIIVRPISAVRNYGGLDQDPVAAGRDLGVEAVLDGSIQTSGEKIRVSARLLSASDGSTLWAYQCDEQRCADIFTMQDAIAEKITGSLTPSLDREERRLLSKHYTDNRQAFQLYSIGRFIYNNKRTREGVKKSVEYYQKAIDLDPNYTLAYSGMADSYNSLGSWFGEPVKEAGPKAKAAALMALKLDETLAEAHASLGKAKFLYDWDWAGAEQELKRAIELNPNCAEAHSAYSIYLGSIGRPEEALAEARRGEELDPLSIFVNLRLERALYSARQYDQAIEQCRKMLEIDPNSIGSHRYLARIYLLKGVDDEAVAEFEIMDRLSGSDPKLGEARGKAYQAGGMRGYLHKRLEQMKEAAKQRFESHPALAFQSGAPLPLDFAEIYAFLGEKDHALEWLQKAWEEHNNGLIYLKKDPVYDGLRADPRFSDLLRRVGLPQ